MRPSLETAPVKPSSVQRHLANIDRCAAMLPRLTCPPRLGWLLAWELSQAFLAEGVRHRTAGNYIGGLIALGVHGGLDAPALDGMRSIQQHLLRTGRRQTTSKVTRIEALYERGGYAEIVRAIMRELETAEALGAWRAKAQTARATAAILAVTLNVPARTGDVVAWRLGEELERSPYGEWRLHWTQQKTGVQADAGTLWPEVGTVLDAHLIAGHAPRYALSRYNALQGMNWLSFGLEPYATRWPSEQVKRALGVPLHDLRTLAADYLRLHDPQAAPDVVSVLLGHSTAQAGEAYKALCVDTAAQRELARIRAALRAPGSSDHRFR